MANIIKKILHNPLELTKRVFLKIFVYPIKYGRKNDYDAASYWDDRFRKHQGNVKSVGIEGLSEEENYEERNLAKKVFLSTLHESFKEFNNLKVLEIGCGTGFYTEMLNDLGVDDYTALDITDAYFPNLKEKFSKYHFQKKDVTTEPHQGEYDLILMMDVVEHIVTDEKLDFAIHTIQTCLKSGGMFLIVPLYKKPKRHLFHVRYWSINELRKRFATSFTITEALARKNEYLLKILKK